MFLSQIIATSYEINNGVCSIDGVVQATTQSCDDAAKTIFTILGAILIPLLIISLVFFIFWIITLVHAIKHDDVNGRIGWIAGHIVALFVGFSWLVTIIYYFAVMRPYKKSKINPGATPTPVQAQNTVTPVVTPTPEVTPTETTPTNPTPSV